jgi:hypothetical protein
VLTSVDDTALKEGEWKKIVGTYLYRAKQVTIDFLKKETTISSGAQIERLQGNLLHLAEETGVKHIPAYRPISRRNLTETIDGIYTSLAHLAQGDTVSILSPTLERTAFNMQLTITPAKIEDLLVATQRINVSDLLLKVKKPDFLGESKWEFVHERALDASIADEIWLARFHARLEPVSPGDALDAKVETIARYDAEGAVVSITHTILKVNGVIKAETPEQQALL